MGFAAALLAGSIFLSRLLGALREAVLSRLAGAGAEVDAYRAAFVLPDYLNYLLAGGALSIALVPLYTRTRKREGDAAADHLLATVLGTMTVIAIALTLLIFWQAELLVGWALPGFDAETRAHTVRLTRILLPGQICFVAGGVLQAALFARERFYAAALAPLIYNASVIAGGVGLSPWLGVEGFAWGTLAGAFLGPLLTRLVELRGRGAISFRVAPLDPLFRKYLWLAAPLMLGVSLLTVDEWYDIIFGQFLGEGAVSHLVYARKLVLLPAGLVSAIAVAAFPTLTRLWEEGRVEEMNRLLLRSLQVGLCINIIATVGFVGFAAPLVTLYYQGGQFGPEDSKQVIVLFRILAVAVPAWTVQQIAVRAFYARGDMWRPMFLGTAITLLALPVYYMMSEAFGIEGLALAGCIGMPANALATLFLARRLHDAPALRTLVGTFLRVGSIAIVALGVGLGTLHLTASWIDALPWVAAELARLLLGGGIFAVLALGGVLRWGDPALREVVLQRLAKRRAAQ